MSIEAMKQALDKAFQLGQRYWSWAHSEYSSHWKKADAAKAEFEQLVEDTLSTPATDAVYVAGLRASISILSHLVDQQRQLLVEVEDVCGRDGHGAPFEDGESELIDKVRAQIAAINPPGESDLFQESHPLRQCTPPAQALPVQEPVAWVLTEELTKRETTTRAHLWFSNPQNCMWTPIYTTPPAAPVQEPVAVYGYCPICGAEGVMRERRPNGYDKCAKGHTYPSSKAITAIKQALAEPVATKLKTQHNVFYVSAEDFQRLKALPVGTKLYTAPPAAELAPVQEPDDDLTQALIERDEYHSIADQLAEVIAQITGADIGEHTSSNFPWHNALDAAKEWIATPPAAPVPEGWKLVPVEPTGEMLAALAQEWHSSRYEAFRGRYALMLTAAPTTKGELK